MMTKEQEMKILAKIEKLIAEAGEDSYIATAFKGCVEDAKFNIEQDAAYSAYDRADSLEEQNRTLTNTIFELEEDLKFETQTRKHMEVKLNAYNSVADTVIHSLDGYLWELITKKDKAEATIIEHCETPECKEFKQAVSDRQEANWRIPEIKQAYDVINEML